jgi:uncharacterized protein (TIGR02147 family)
MHEPNLLSYSDYRLFLKDLYLYQKRVNSTYTYEKFSRKAQIKSPNFLKLIIDDKKNLTPKTLLQFTQALELDDLETSYFEALVLENQAESHLEKRYYGKRLKSLMPLKAERRTIRVSSKMNIFEDPLVPLILSLVVGENPEQALPKIFNQTGINLQKIEKILHSFVQQGVIDVSKGTYRCDFDHAIFHESPSNIQLKKYIQSHLRYSIKAFEKKYSQEAKFFVHDMAINSQDYPKLIEEINRFIQHINQTFDRVPGEKCVSINIQSFWLDRDLI